MWLLKRDLFISTALLSTPLVLLWFFTIMFLVHMWFIGAFLLPLALLLTYVIVGYVLRKLERYRLARAIASDIVSYRDYRLYLRRGFSSIPGYLVLEARRVYRGDYSFIGTTTMFIPVPMGFFEEDLGGGHRVLDYSFSLGQGFFIAVGRDGMGYALLPAYCSERICIAVLDPGMVSMDRVCRDNILYHGDTMLLCKACIDRGRVHGEIVLNGGSPGIKGGLCILEVPLSNTTVRVELGGLGMRVWRTMMWASYPVNP